MQSSEPGEDGLWCYGLGIDQSMGWVGSCFDDAAAESFFSTLEWELLRGTTREHAGRSSRC